MLLDFPIPIPTIDAQNKFAAIRCKLLTLCAILEAHHRQAEELFSSLSQRAFRGDL